MLRDLISDRIRAQGPITVAEYMELALYHPAHGYYARASRRSGRAGDFFTSVDVGPLFGALLGRQLADMHRILEEKGLRESFPGSADDADSRRPVHFDLVEAGASDGRLARDVLDWAAREDPAFYAAVRLSLVERSAAARAAQIAALGPHAAKLRTSRETLPEQVHGAIIANELLDAMPAHSVTMTGDGLRELYVDTAGDRLALRPGPLSSPAIAEHLARVGAELEPGWRGEVNLAAPRWISAAARALRRGFLLLIDYGHEARELYSAAHARGTLSSYRAHAVEGSDADAPAWLQAPGECDLTAHVDLTTVRVTAEAEGLDTLAILDQTYFLIGLGLADLAATDAAPDSRASLKRRLAAKTLLLPGGLGSIQKVLIFGRNVGRPALRGLSYKVRVT